MNVAEANDSVTLQLKLVSEMCSLAQKNEIKKLKIHVEQSKLDVNAPYKKGVTALHYACKNQSMDAVFYLLSQGGNLEQRDASNPPRTPRSYLSVDSIRRLAEYYIKDAQKETKESKEIEKPNDKQEQDFCPTIGCEEDAVLTVNDKTYIGTKYTVIVQKASEGSELCLNITNHGYSAEGDLQVGISIPGKNAIVPFFKLHKTAGHDFYIKQLNMKGPTKTAEVMIFRTPPDYEGIDGNILPRKEGTININGKPELWLAPEENPACYKRSHSPGRS